MSFGCLLGCFWVSLGLLLGALGGLLGVSWAPLGWSWGLLGASWAALGNSWGLVGGDVGVSWKLLAGILASSLVHVFFEVVLFSSSKVLGTILVSTTDLPTLKNKVFSLHIRRILRILLF